MESQTKLVCTPVEFKSTHFYFPHKETLKDEQILLVYKWKWYDLTGPSKQEEAVISIAIVILN